VDRWAAKEAEDVRGGLADCIISYINSNTQYVDHTDLLHGSE
jgi:hypothetical protein